MEKCAKTLQLGQFNVDGKCSLLVKHLQLLPTWTSTAHFVEDIEYGCAISFLANFVVARNGLDDHSTHKMVEYLAFRCHHLFYSI
jgi:hypothetical protein